MQIVAGLRLGVAAEHLVDQTPNAHAGRFAARHRSAAGQPCAAAAAGAAEAARHRQSRRAAADDAAGGDGRSRTWPPACRPILFRVFESEKLNVYSLNIPTNMNTRVARFFLVQKWGKICQMITKLPNAHKIYPNCYFGLKINHLATQMYTVRIRSLDPYAPKRSRCHYVDHAARAKKTLLRFIYDGQKGKK
jgi:hypothetical protein